jgi:hypothetical protein
MYTRVPDRPEFRPGVPTSREEMRRIARLADRTERGDGTPGSDIDVGAGGFNFANSFPQGFWARLTAAYGQQGAYGWLALDSAGYLPNPGGQPPQLIHGANGYAGTTSLLPAFEINANNGLAVNSPAVAVSGVTAGTVTPTVTTKAPHGASAGSEILITGVEGAGQVNGYWFVAEVVDATNFKVTTPVPTSPYTSGGTVQLQNGSVQWLVQGNGEYMLFTAGGAGAAVKTIYVPSATVDPVSKMWAGVFQTPVDGAPITYSPGVAGSPIGCWVWDPNGGPLSPTNAAGQPQFYKCVFELIHSDGMPVYSIFGIVIGGQCVNGTVQLVT